MTAWQTNTFSNSEINNAGKVLLDKNCPAEKYLSALNVFEAWRASHAYPLTVFQNYLRHKVKDIDASAIVAQRLKKRSSILNKLVRFPSMELARMQDIGGCRIIVKDVESVCRLTNDVVSSRRRHVLKNKKDYITNPQTSGYRGVHLVYQYVSESNQHYRNILLEIQIRTHLQHLWATAVETVGVFTQEALKSNQGSDKWLEFFKLVSSLFALEEGCTTAPGTPADRESIIHTLNEMCKEYNLLPQMHAFNVAAEYMEGVKKGYYYVISLDYSTMRVSVSSFSKDAIKVASSLYGSYEGKDNIDAVLVSVDSLNTLRKAYPNYFLNVKEFARKVEKYLSIGSK